VDSWYAATANLATRYPSLQENLDVDIAVVGGGYTGVNTAIELADRGYRVVVLEARRVGWGCSGRNGGQMIAGLASYERLVRQLGADDARKVWQLGVDGLQIIHERIRRFAIRCDLKMGVFLAACNRRQLAALRVEFERDRLLGYPHRLEWVEGERVGSIVGTHAYRGGVLDQGSGHLHPLNLCLGEAAGAAAAGVRIFEQTAVRRIERGARPRVHTDAGSVSADQVVIAGDAYLDGLVPELRGYTLPAGSYIVATEPLMPGVAQELFPRDCAICDTNVLLDYYRLSPDRRILFGGRCNHTGRVPRDISGALLPRLVRVFPALRGIRVDYEWGGTVSVSLKRIPQLGRLPGGLVYAQGYSGHGLVPTHVFARLIAGAISGTLEQFDLLARIRHWWLPGGKWFASPALALGMTWYRLRDLL
jgi:glycine/D-amino acid oxidase-like deaminating enzyme